METLVTADFRIFDIVFYTDHGQVILFSDHLCKTVNIRSKRADNTDSCNIVNIISHILDRTLISVTL